MNRKMIEGFVFDFDGLILDTEMPQFNCWKEIFQKYGSTYTIRDWWKTFDTATSGYSPAEDLYQRMNGKVDRGLVNQWVDQKTSEILKKQPLLPGVEPFIRSAHEQGIKLAVATSSSPEWAMPFLEKFDLVQFFDVVLTSRDVQKVKPDPTLYQLAIEKLGLAPDSAMAFEDSFNGLQSAKSAGIYCTVVANQITREMDFRRADKIVASFDQISVEEMRHFAFI